MVNALTRLFRRQPVARQSDSHAGSAQRTALRAIFDDITPTPQERVLFERCRNREPPKETYCVAMTPRTGSTWLYDLVEGLQGLGSPQEWFNINRVKKIATRGFGYSSFDDYVEGIGRERMGDNGVFGVKISFRQYELLARSCDIERVFPRETRYIYLHRRDIVAQALSMYRARETGVYHRTRTEQSRAREPAFNFSDEGMWHWLDHIYDQEHGWWCLFRERQIEPLRISYEELVSNTARSLQRLVNFLGHPELTERIGELSSTYETTRAPEDGYLVRSFSERYRREIEVYRRHRGTRDAKYLREKVL